MSYFNPKPCRICGSDIYFDDKIKSSSGKPIPMDYRTKEPHNCNLNLIHNFREEIASMRDKITDFETLLTSLHIKERLDDIEKRLENLEGGK